MKKLLFGAIILGLLAIPSIRGVQTLDRQMGYERTVMQNLADFRKVKGLEAVTKNKVLVWSSRLKAEQMEATCRFTHHVYRQGDWTKTFRRAGYKNNAMGEVLAKGFKSASNVVPAWVRSETHYGVIANTNYTKVGVYAYKSRCDGKIWVVGHFGN